MRTRLRFALPILVTALVVVACTPTPPAEPDPTQDPVIAPAGPVEARVGTSVEFQVQNIAGAVEWAVDGVPGGAPETGTVVDGVYQAPPRVPAEATVTVTATDTEDPARRASAEVTVTAPGTLYVLDEVVYVYGDMDSVDGNTAPDRTFTLVGVGGGNVYYEMTMDPATDMAFISVLLPSPNVYRVADISATEGQVEAVAFSTLAYTHPAGLAYDAQRDILYVQVYKALLAYDDASSAPAGAEPTRVVEGPALDSVFDWDSRLVLDTDADRLFVTHYEGRVAVYESASTIDGEALPDRVIEVDAPVFYIWGLDYDLARDELYLGDQKDGVGVYVVPGASTADGLVAPSRSIGGPEHPFTGPSQLGYDAANDRLVVIDADGADVKVFDGASALDGDVAPSRVLSGDQLPLLRPSSGYLDPTM